jgi:hypothetical protein
VETVSDHLAEEIAMLSDMVNGFADTEIEPSASLIPPSAPI